MEVVVAVVVDHRRHPRGSKAGEAVERETKKRKRRKRCEDEDDGENDGDVAVARGEEEVEDWITT